MPKFLLCERLPVGFLLHSLLEPRAFLAGPGRGIPHSEPHALPPQPFRRRRRFARCAAHQPLCLRRGRILLGRCADAQITVRSKIFDSLVSAARAAAMRVLPVSGQDAFFKRLSREVGKAFALRLLHLELSAACVGWSPGRRRRHVRDAFQMAGASANAQIALRS